MTQSPTTSKGSRTKAEQRAATYTKLTSVARELFARDGYGQVSLSEIVAAAGVTKGALYHQFSSKEALFRAVLGQLHQEVADQIAAEAGDADPWEQMLAGCRGFLTASTAPGIQRIMLIDAPAVLGWRAWRELDAQTSVRHLEEAIVALIEADVIERQPVAPLVHLLSGAMNEAALWLAGSPSRDRDLKDAMAALTAMLTSLRKSP